MDETFSGLDDIRVALSDYLDSPNASREAAEALDRLVDAIERA